MLSNTTLRWITNSRRVVVKHGTRTMVYFMVYFMVYLKKFTDQTRDWTLTYLYPGNCYR